MPAAHSTITLAPRKIAVWLSAVSCVLIVGHAVGMVMKYGMGRHYVYGLVPFFDLDHEHNAPTLFSTFLFLMNSGLFLCLWKTWDAAQEKNNAWLFFSALFFLLGIDEFASIHETLITPVRSALGTSGVLYFAWINPYGIAVLAICIYYFPLFWRMDWHIRRLFFLSAFIYLTGAVGCEMLGGRFFELNRKQPHLVYEIVVACEELLEMCGLILLTYTLLMLMQRRCGGIAIVVPGDGTTAPATNHSDPN